jgi:hypothetical protein
MVRQRTTGSGNGQSGGMLRGGASRPPSCENSTTGLAADRRPECAAIHPAGVVAGTLELADSMSDPNKIRYYMKYHFEHSVIAISATEWSTLVESDGQPTLVEEVPNQISAVLSEAEVVVVAASGISNPNPGIDLVRKDIKDAPYIYNTDHYMVIERLPSHPAYSRILGGAGVEDSPELQETLNSRVWIIGPERDPEHHWATEVPKHIRNARKKR